MAVLPQTPHQLLFVSRSGPSQLNGPHQVMATVGRHQPLPRLGEQAHGALGGEPEHPQEEPSGLPLPERGQALTPPAGTPGLPAAVAMTQKHLPSSKALRLWVWALPKCSVPQK